ncbi:alpha-1,2-fucosyltransferase [Endomicrobium sp. AH-315-J14]|nr:alpha-1,2-fucosyltransferase [Endomicrobium sp. AH-315-J14]
MIGLAYRDHTVGLGNYFFQYALLRATAERLGTRFHFPAWVGDEVLELDDAALRVPASSSHRLRYLPPDDDCGFDRRALSIDDDTLVWGYFMSERYFSDRAAVRRWFRFKDEAAQRVRAKYAHIDFDEAASIHYRFGDKRTTFYHLFYTPGLPYYRQAYERLGRPTTLLVFSDEPERARREAARIGAERMVVMDDNEAYEDLYLMSLCRHHISSASSLSWWAGWLGDSSRKTVVCPAEWMRPGTVKHTATTPRGWIEIATAEGWREDPRLLRILRGVHQLVDNPLVDRILPQGLRKTLRDHGVLMRVRN